MKIERFTASVELPIGLSAASRYEVGRDGVRSLELLGNFVKVVCQRGKDGLKTVYVPLQNIKHLEGEFNEESGDSDSGKAVALDAGKAAGEKLAPVHDVRKGRGRIRDSG